MRVGNRHYRSIWAEAADGLVHIIDQSRLPHVFETKTLATAEEVGEAIRAMRVRGAPLIGVAAAFGLGLAARKDATDASLDHAAEMLQATRPTAVNLAWALARVREKLQATRISERGATAWQEAQAIADEDVRLNEAIGRHGLTIIERAYSVSRRPVNILTH